MGCSRRLLVVSSLLCALSSVAQAQVEVLSGEELYIDRLGCWNCHGMTGGGGAGPVISETALSLRTFAMYVRLPSGEMPRISARLASDADLATLYRWLDGVEAPETPLPIEIGLEATSAPGDASVVVTLTIRAAETSAETDPLDTDGMQYRLTLHTMVPWEREKKPVAHQAIEYQLAGHEDWSTFTTDERGEAFLGAEQGFGLAEAGAVEPIIARLRTALPEGRHALVVEAILGIDPTKAVVLGIGTVVLRGS